METFFKLAVGTLVAAVLLGLTMLVSTPLALLAAYVMDDVFTLYTQDLGWESPGLLGFLVVWFIARLATFTTHRQKDLVHPKNNDEVLMKAQSSPALDLFIPYAAVLFGWAQAYLIFWFLK